MNRAGPALRRSEDSPEMNAAPRTAARIALVALPALGLLAAAVTRATPPPAGVAGPRAESTQPAGPPVARTADPRERHLANLRQLTDGGENAEAYFSFDGRSLIFQSTRPPHGCDQIFTMDLDGGGVKLLSTGTGRTTCSYFLPDGRRYFYASTHLGSRDCPPSPDMSQGYTWALYRDYDIFVASLDDPTPARLTDTPGYDAEATISPRGDRIVFTSMRDGDLDLYTMRLDGSDVRRLTGTVGYDGGAFFSPDGAKVVWRASRPREGAELDDYRRLLAQGLIRPSRLDLYVADADGANVRRLTDNGAANFGPFFHPSGRKVIFSSNLDAPRSRNFELYLIDLDGSGLERVTFYAEFDGFPMWAPDGKTFVFCSNRFNAKPGETNVFLADWVD
jgi:Tol biopolymer transport system component